MDEDILSTELAGIEECRSWLEEAIQSQLRKIGDIQIGSPRQFPLGWRKAAKGRTIWRLLEEVVSQNLEAAHKPLGFSEFYPAETEVGVFDFRFSWGRHKDVYVNIKSAVKGGRASKDDISKARLIEQLYRSKPHCTLLIATIHVEFLPSMSIRLLSVTVMPVSWIPDIYVNPSNNGNLQSSKYKQLSEANRRTNAEFLRVLQDEIAIADRKRLEKHKS